MAAHDLPGSDRRKALKARQQLKPITRADRVSIADFDHPRAAGAGLRQAPAMLGQLGHGRRRQAARCHEQ